MSTSTIIYVMSAIGISSCLLVRSRKLYKKEKTGLYRYYLIIGIIYFLTSIGLAINQFRLNDITYILVILHAGISCILYTLIIIETITKIYGIK